MTRKEEIKIAAVDYVRLSNRICPDEQSFFDGAEWADNNPKTPWISVEDNLPEQDEEVIVLRDEFNTSYFYKISFAHIVDKTVCRDYNGWNVSDVVYWFPMPKIPKTGD